MPFGVFRSFIGKKNRERFWTCRRKAERGAEEVFRQLLRKYNLSKEMLVQKADQGQGADLVKENSFVRQGYLAGKWRRWRG